MNTHKIILLIWTAVIFSLSLTACRKSHVYIPDPEVLRKERFGEHGEFLRHADRLQIYSVESTGPSQSPKDSPTDEEFHGFRIYGKTQIEDKKVIEVIWSEMNDRIYSDPGDRTTYCFWPRHAIRAFHGDEIRDYLICFQCNHLYVYVDPNSDKYERIGLEKAQGELKLNELLDQANIHRELPESRK